MNRQQRAILLAVGLVAFWGIGLGGAIGSAVQERADQQAAREKTVAEAAAAIKDEDLRDTLHLFAHDTLKGRGSVDGGYDFPSLFLARELKKLGIAPRGDVGAAMNVTHENGICELVQVRSYFQNFDFPQQTVVREPGQPPYLKTLYKPSRNVLGYIEGEKKDEWVIVGAHYDHVGLGETGRREGNRGDIFRGADDNGSGTVATLAVAESFAKLAQKGAKPKRSILFCFWGAEEWGEHGSLHFASHFVQTGIDKEKVAGYINMDMVGRNEDGKLSLLCGQVLEGETESNPEKCKDLYTLAETVNQKMKIGFAFSHRDTDSEFERSDQWSFYQALRNGGRRIPCWFLTTGEHADYHTPTDTWDKINYPKLARVAKLAFGIAWQISQMDAVPAYK